MKVAFLIEQLDPRRGGMETSASEFLTEMAALGANVHVVTRKTVADFSVAPVHELGSGGFGRAGRYRTFIYGAGSFLASSSWDVVHAVTPCLRCDLYQPRSGVAEEALARMVALRRNWIARAMRKFGAALDAKQHLWMNTERQLLQRSTPPVVAALSRYMRRQLQNAYGLPSERVRDVFNGVTVELPEPAERAVIRQRLRQELQLSPADQAAIFAGHNFRRKGLPRLLEALSRPAAQRWRLLVAGKDAIGPSLRYARKLGVAERVQFLGARPDVRQLYLAADVCVLPTYYDPCSRTVLEALSLGVPSITTSYDGSRECIRDGEHGYVLKSPDDVDALAHALKDLSVEGVRQRISQNALKLRPYLSMRRHAKEVAALYEEIVRTAAPTPMLKQI